MPPQPRTKRVTASQAKARSATSKASPSQPKQRPTAQDIKPSEPAHSIFHILLVFPIILVVAGLSITTHVYQRDIEPLYGSIPATLHTGKFIWAASIAGILGPVPPAWPSLGVAGALICAIPNSSYWVAAYTGQFGPLLGPLLTHLVVLFPPAYLAITLVKSMVIIFEGEKSENSVVRLTILPACASVIMGFQPIWDVIPFFAKQTYSDSQILFAIGAAGIAVSVVSLPFTGPDAEVDGTAASSAVRMSKRLIIPSILIPLLPVLAPYLEAPVLPHPLTEPYSSPDYPLRILSSVSSVTGMIVVGETCKPGEWVPGMPEPFPFSLRYLRAGHSLLGGVWIGDRMTTRSQAPIATLDVAGTQLGDSIYSAFNLQEAIRLVDTEGRNIVEGKEEALIIGLGAGIAATALTRHGISTTIVEIDPAVYNASRQFFGLPDVGADKVFLDDASKVVYDKKKEVEKGTGTTYDFVIHDCFSGGSVPDHLYTVQFWDNLKAIMNPEGIVAVNYAGMLGSNPARAVLLTLQKSFGQCRAFHDGSAALSEEELLKDFTNLVIFCSPSMTPITFREPVEADYLDSHLRAHVLDTLSESEVDLKTVRGDLGGKSSDQWVLTIQNNRLREWQKDGALNHWYTMRSVLPEPIWLTY
ncbi:hypothetical protein BV25DRAFT_1873861 [Artomyces pyxidatus]|uniref:Uncharacterized protein n=1 Tax=Artomyces pyxidatus TaxID=48021 RepID=A0ACB8TJW5_9AGAM|nr:hypothetical protein BV25DRAFT_1873861 [Artomyces pyxidatus]